MRSVSEGMHIPLREIYRMRDARRVLVNFTPEGRVLRVDGLDRPGPSRRSEMDTMLQRLAETVAEARSLEDLTRPMLEMLERASGFESVYLTTIDEKAGLQHILFSHNVRRLRVPEGLTVKWEDTLCKRALEEGEHRGRRRTDPLARRQGRPGARHPLLRHRAGARRRRRLRHAVRGEPTPAHPVPRGGASAPDVRPDDRPAGRAGGDDREPPADERRPVRGGPRRPLTGLPNRRALLAELARMLARSQRDGSRVHVAFLDLDGFEDFNQRHGREVADALLVAVAARIDGVVRGGDFAARYGGDEFVVLAWSADTDGSAEDLRQRLSKAVRGRYELGDLEVDHPGASVGIITAEPGDASDAVLARADEAMYEVKRQRRARWAPERPALLGSRCRTDRRVPNRRHRRPPELADR